MIMHRQALSGLQSQRLRGHGPSIFALAVIGTLFVGCAERSHDLTGPGASRSLLDGKPLNENKMAKLRQIGEGCLVAMTDSAGTVRATAFPRKALPFSMPALQHRPGVEGTGRVLQFDLTEPGSRRVTVSCWAPDTLTISQLAALMKGPASGTAWNGIVTSMPSAPVLPPASGRTLTREGMEFETEMLAPRWRFAAASPSALNDCTGLTSLVSGKRRASQDCTCLSIVVNLWYDGTSWNFNFDSSGCIDYTSYGGDYTSLVETTVIWPCSGTTTPYESDIIVAQYHDPSLYSPDSLGSLDGPGTMPDSIRYRSHWYPGCGDMLLYRPTDMVTQIFKWSDLKDPLYSYGVLQIPILVVAGPDHYGLDFWVQTYVQTYGSARTITSGYRTPYHNAHLPNGVVGKIGSSHMRGVAIDLNNNSGTQNEYDQMVAAARTAQASYIEPTKFACGIVCTHADWRWWVTWPLRQ